MAQLDRKKDFAEHFYGPDFAGDRSVRFTQGGKSFDKDGNEVGAKSAPVAKPAESKPAEKTTQLDAQLKG